MNEQHAAALEVMAANGLTVGEAITFFAERQNETEKAYVAYARDELARDGEIEFDDNSIASIGGDPGAYVMGWVWVPANDAGLCAICDETLEDEDDREDPENASCNRCYHDEKDSGL